MQIAKSQSAYEYIKEMILTGELSPRIDISEKQLQQELSLIHIYQGKGVLEIIL